MRPSSFATALVLVAACGSGSATPDGPGPGPDAPRSDAGGPLPAGARRFGIEVNQPDGFDHGVELMKAQAIGSSAVGLTFPWNVLEPDAGQRDLTQLELELTYYRDRGVTVLLSIPTIDTVEKMFPTDLMTVVLDRPEIQARLDSLLDDVLAISGPELTYLVIGNEADVFFEGHLQSHWDNYEQLISGAVAHVNSVRPEIEVGLAVAFRNIGNPQVTGLTAGTDVRFVNYYFDGNDGTPADDVPADFAAMVAYAGAQPLVLKALGDPTGPATGGSEASQADFVREVFAAWDANAPSIPLVMFSVMFDRERADCEAMADYYGFPGDEAFIQFLCTLGFRTSDDQPKPGWDTIATDSAARGF